ncbi:MAG: hypothetical protein QM757_26595 [Paludibaculum sp.]
MNNVTIDPKWVRQVLGLMAANPQVFALANDMRVKQAEILAAQICPPDGGPPRGMGQVVQVSLEALEGTLAAADENGADATVVAEAGRRATTQLLVTAVLAGAIWGFIAGSVGIDSDDDSAEVEPGEIKISSKPVIN